MKTTQKKRRSKRVSAAHRLMLKILGADGGDVVKEVVTTVELSRHGARLRGRRALTLDARGLLVQLRSGEQIPFRVAWQIKAPAGQGYLDTGVEFLEDSDFWKQTFSREETAPAAAEEAATPLRKLPPEKLLPEKLLEDLLQSPAFQDRESGLFLEGVWCGLVEQLEERHVFTRAELVASLRAIGPL
jgi:hypothetical protein